MRLIATIAIPLLALAEIPVPAPIFPLLSPLNDLFNQVTGSDYTLFTKMSSSHFMDPETRGATQSTSDGQSTSDADAARPQDTDDQDIAAVARDDLRELRETLDRVQEQLSEVKRGIQDTRELLNASEPDFETAQNNLANISEAISNLDARMNSALNPANDNLPDELFDYANAATSALTIADLVLTRIRSAVREGGYGQGDFDVADDFAAASRQINRASRIVERMVDLSRDLDGVVSAVHPRQSTTSAPAQEISA
eukprot:Blabericola_migrator_1__8106@NODE_4175_length_1297_cov_5_373171_g2586_i0_p1_GENE_NODE_4175_length_1297_cov_5_373171_g2586_i0NODE_4175_length_1297_cov_5_373171_g2586_i0_p1_ORF_typecomplete_len255_score39_44Laminin_II/PF06009_12/0_0005Laminin_II/PF06009_12/41ATG16/PF08614_11/1_6e05Spc7/PF08317_11/3_2e05HAUSaugmin3/PF14932_6/0_00027EzrA/PF06160_12/0_00029MCPsignal/PF00015_21/0_005MCPsignal/PF00015_21/1_7e02DUF1664/PF07889_12/0_0028DUF1664/PF07889_12/1_3e03Filament/PF00038_21/0_0033Snapin_Pallidin/P